MFQAQLWQRGSQQRKEDFRRAEQKTSRKWEMEVGGQVAKEVTLEREEHSRREAQGVQSPWGHTDHDKGVWGGSIEQHQGARPDHPPGIKE